MAEDRWKHNESGEGSSHDTTEVEMGARLVSPQDRGWSSDPPSQHISNVLGDALSRRRGDRLHQCLSETPTSLCNWPAIGLSFTTLILLALVLIQDRKPSTAATSTPSPPLPSADADSQASPEGRILGNFSFAEDYRGRPRNVTGTNGVVAADHGRCSDRGISMLRRHGNAVDAAIATALCQGIHNPQASGIGGGTFMLIRSPNGSVEVIDAREPAPAAATFDMYSGYSSNASVDGGRAIAVPLELKGLWLAHQRHGSLPWAQLVRPAAQVARTGFAAHPYLINSLKNGQMRNLQFQDMRETFYIKDGEGWRPPEVNETCCARPALADLLEAVAQAGPAALDQHAQELAEEIQGAGGIITASDLLDAQPIIRQPLRSQLWGMEVLVAPPPSSGACVVAALQYLAGYSLPQAFAGGLGAHHLVEAMKHAFALRGNLGDPGVCPGPGCFLNLTSLLDDMLSPGFAAQLRNLSSDVATGATAAYGGRWHVNATEADDHGTSHISVIDAQQGAVAMTTTINTGFGSKVISKSTGILFNNQMDDFAIPGKNNTYEVAPTQANYIRPHRKSLSSMSPTLVLNSTGGVRIVIGASGGPRIITTVLQVLLRLVAMGQDPLAAVGSPRLHHQLLPDVVHAEDWSAGDLSIHVNNYTLQALRRRGHNVTGGTWSGVLQAILVDPETGILSGASDPRKDGAPSAF